MNFRIFPRIVLIFTIIFISFFLNACHLGIVPTSEADEENGGSGESDNNISIHSYLMIRGNSSPIIDCTPELVIYTEKEDIVSMSFSGNNTDWSQWVDYSEVYDQFNIASGFDGTNMDSGFKTLYVRFKDTTGTIYPQDLQSPICCDLEYEMQELFSIIIEPGEAEVRPGGSVEFSVHGYDLKLNEVPLNGDKIIWTKYCDVGKLEPVKGLKTTYIAPEIPGLRNISAHYGSLGTGAKIKVSQQ